jgi:hypothetical protein
VIIVGIIQSSLCMDISSVQPVICQPNAAKELHWMFKGKEQPERRIYSAPGAMRKTVGLSYKAKPKCCEGIALDV